jgi:HEAT repeat protein
VRCEAARAIARIAPADDRVIAALSRALRDKQYGVRATAAELLGKCSPSAGKAVDALAQALSDERKEVCRAAALSLGKIGKGGVSVLIKGTGGDSADHTRIYCVRALGHAGRDRETAQAVDALIKALEDSNARVRREAVWALGLIGPGAKSAYKALERSAEKDSDYIVAGASAEVLDRIAGSQ